MSAVSNILDPSLQTILFNYIKVNQSIEKIEDQIKVESKDGIDEITALTDAAKTSTELLYATAAKTNNEVQKQLLILIPDFFGNIGNLEQKIATLEKKINRFTYTELNGEKPFSLQVLEDYVELFFKSIREDINRIHKLDSTDPEKINSLLASYKANVSCIDLCLSVPKIPTLFLSDYSTKLLELQSQFNLEVIEKLSPPGQPRKEEISKWMLAIKLEYGDEIFENMLKEAISNPSLFFGNAIEGVLTPEEMTRCMTRAEIEVTLDTMIAGLRETKPLDFQEIFKFLEENELDPKDALNGKRNIAHVLFERLYNIYLQAWNNNNSTIDLNSMIHPKNGVFKGDFGRHAFLNTCEAKIPDSYKLKAISEVRAELKAIWG